MGACGCVSTNQKAKSNGKASTPEPMKLETDKGDIRVQEADEIQIEPVKIDIQPANIDNEKPIQNDVGTPLLPSNIEEDKVEKTEEQGKLEPIVQMKSDDRTTEDKVNELQPQLLSDEKIEEPPIVLSEDKVEEKVEDKVEEKVEDKVEDKVEENVEDKVDEEQCPNVIEEQPPNKPEENSAKSVEAMSQVKEDDENKVQQEFQNDKQEIEVQQANDNMFSFSDNDSQGAETEADVGDDTAQALTKSSNIRTLNKIQVYQKAMSDAVSNQNGIGTQSMLVSSKMQNNNDPTNVQSQVKENENNMTLGPETQELQ